MVERARASERRDDGLVDVAPVLGRVSVSAIAGHELHFLQNDGKCNSCPRNVYKKSK